MQPNKFLCSQEGHENREIIGFCLFGKCSTAPLCFKCIKLFEQNLHKQHMEFCLDFLEITEALEKQCESLFQENLDFEDLLQKLRTSQLRIQKIFNYKQEVLIKKIQNIVQKVSKFKAEIEGRKQVIQTFIAPLKHEDYNFVLKELKVLKNIFRKKQSENRVVDQILNQLILKERHLINKIEIKKIKSLINRAAELHYQRGNNLVNEKKYVEAISQYDEALLRDNQLIKCYCSKFKTLNKLVKIQLGFGYSTKPKNYSQNFYGNWNKKKQKNCKSLLKIAKNVLK